MKALNLALLGASFLLAVPLFAADLDEDVVSETDPLVVAPSIPNVCYDTLENTQFCTHDNVGKVQVFIYNAGWCGPCNSEMHELSQDAVQFEGQPVVFASLSGEGWSRGAKPTAKFMGEWKAKHGIPFVVASKYRDFGKAFNSPGSIPFAVIVDKSGAVSKSGFMSSSEISNRVRQLLN